MNDNTKNIEIMKHDKHDKHADDADFKDLRRFCRDARPCVSTVPKGHNFHNRRSLTCGIGAHHNLCSKDRTDVAQTVVNKPSSTNHRHCEERSDEAIHNQVNTINHINHISDK
jgi:hypothetical protein